MPRSAGKRAEGSHRLNAGTLSLHPAQGPCPWNPPAFLRRKVLRLCRSTGQRTFEKRGKYFPRGECRKAISQTRLSDRVILSGAETPMAYLHAKRQRRVCTRNANGVSAKSNCEAVRGISRVGSRSVGNYHLKRILTSKLQKSAENTFRAKITFPSIGANGLIYA